jgi:hypothetical protein
VPDASGATSWRSVVVVVLDSVLFKSSRFTADAIIDSKVDILCRTLLRYVACSSLSALPLPFLMLTMVVVADDQTGTAGIVPWSPSSRASWHRGYRGRGNSVQWISRASWPCLSSWHQLAIGPAVTSKNSPDAAPGRAGRTFKLPANRVSDKSMFAW